MDTVSIHGSEKPVSKVFSNDYVFKVPLYQRPYAWTSKESGDLLDDLMSFLGDDDELIDKANPYFLGSIVLIKADNKPEVQIVDGQQRLTTLTILFAALRALLPPQHAEELTTFLYEEGSSIMGTPNRYRLQVRDRDNEFFRNYIQNKEGIQKLSVLNADSLSDSQWNMRENALQFLETLSKVPNNRRLRLASFLVRKCILVVVTTPDIGSAYRIFSVLNDRGLDLTLTDILKADIIGAITLDHPHKEEDYTQKWEDIEERLGRDLFEELFAHIRTIQRKTKLQESILSEIRAHVRPADRPEQFMDEVLIPYADALYEISNEKAPGGKKVNNLLKWLNLIDNSDWLPSAILFLARNHHRPDSLEIFFKDLERLAAALMIRGVNVNKRIERYSPILTAIEKDEDLSLPGSPLQLTDEGRQAIMEILDSDLYWYQRVCRYVLLRLDTALSGGEASYDHSVVSIEHVLPQNPASSSRWLTWFPTQEKRDVWVHRIGNLVLLSRRKNSQAQNFDFEEKKKKYFATPSGVSAFALTTGVLQEDRWTPAVVAKRQTELISVLKKLWRL